MNKLKEKGITLVALVVTIIILLILAGVTISIALSDNGIIGRTIKAREMYNIEEYKEVLEVIGKDAKLQEIEEKWDVKTYMDKYAEKIENNEKFKKSKVQRISEEKNETEIEEKIIVETEEQYIFLITEQGVEYIGKQGDKGLELPPELQEGDIKYSKTKSDWTNKPVEVKIWTEKSDFILEYSLDDKIWRKYNESVKLIAENNNTKFYARLVNKIGQTNGEKLTITVDNIDREKPEEFEAQGIGKPTSIEAIGNAVDKEATDIDGMSGIDKYYFSIDNGDTWLPEEGVKVEEGKESKYTFEDLNRKTKYKLLTKAVDKAENDRISKETEVETTIEVYTIKYDINGGTGDAPANQTKEHGKTIQITTDVPIRDGYVFQGWATTKELADAGEVKYNAGADYSEDKDITLYAVWKKLVPKTTSLRAYVNGSGITNKTSYSTTITTDMGNVTFSGTYTSFAYGWGTGNFYVQGQKDDDSGWINLWSNSLDSEAGVENKGSLNRTFSGYKYYRLYTRGTYGDENHWGQANFEVNVSYNSLE